MPHSHVRHADGRMDQHEFRRLVRTGFEGIAPNGEGSIEGFGEMAVSDAEVWFRL